MQILFASVLVYVSIPTEITSKRARFYLKNVFSFLPYSVYGPHLKRVLLITFTAAVIEASSTAAHFGRRCYLSMLLKGSRLKGT